MTLRSTAGGFTMVELTIVMAILAIVASAGFPLLLSSLNEAQLNAATEEVVGALVYARQASLRTERNCRVSFFMSGDSLTVKNLTVNRAVLDPASDTFAYDKVDSVSYSYVRHPLRKELEYVVRFGLDSPFGGVDLFDTDFGGDDRVTFDRYGIPDSGGKVALRRDGVITTVVLDAATGAVTLVGAP